MSSGWQPIETAPKDGTEILVGGGDIPTPRVGYWGRNYYTDTFHWHMHEGTFDNPPDCYCEVHPTHWMPLPELREVCA